MRYYQMICHESTEKNNEQCFQNRSYVGMQNQNKGTQIFIRIPTERSLALEKHFNFTTQSL